MFTYLTRFKETISGARMAGDQWGMRFQDILTGFILNYVQDSLIKDRQSFAMVCGGCWYTRI